MTASTDPRRLDFGVVKASLTERARIPDAGSEQDAARRATAALEAAELCRLEELETAEQLRLEAQVRAGEAWIRVCPGGYRHAEFATLDYPPEILRPLVGWLERARAGAGENLVFIGPVGTGKTYLGLAVARELHFADHSCRFEPATELLEALKPGGDGGDMARFARVDVLVIDDLGTEWPTEWTACQLNRLLNLRSLERRPAVVTTNLQPPQLGELYGARFRSRLGDGAVVLSIGGNDRRAGLWAP